jgi:hypothetical protein
MHLPAIEHQALGDGLTDTARCPGHESSSHGLCWSKQGYGMSWILEVRRGLYIDPEAYRSLRRLMHREPSHCKGRSIVIV